MNLGLSSLYRTLELEVSNLTPIFVSGVDSENQAPELRGTEIVAAWKRSIRMLSLLTEDPRLKRELDRLHETLQAGAYLLRIEPEKSKSIVEIQKKKNPFLDLRFKNESSIKLYQVRARILLAIPQRPSLKSIDPELAFETFIFTLKTTGLGKISAKGFGKLRIEDARSSTQEQLVKLALEPMNQARFRDLLKEHFSISENRYRLAEVRVSAATWRRVGELILNNRYEGELFNRRNVREVKLSAEEDGELRDLARLYAFYLVRACESKTKVIWKLANRLDRKDSGKCLHTFVLGLPRFSKIKERLSGTATQRSFRRISSGRSHKPQESKVKLTGYLIDIRSLDFKLRSQIKYIPELASNSGTVGDLVLMLFVPWYSQKLVDILANYLKHCIDCYNNKYSSVKRLLKDYCNKVGDFLDSKDPFDQAFEKIAKIFTSEEPWRH